MCKTIVGYENEKVQINQLHNMLKNSDKYLEHGVRIPRGLVLCGEPGVGKSVMARSIATEGINLLELKPFECNDEDVSGDIEGIFKRAKENGPCVLLIDELDKIAAVDCIFPSDTDRTVNKTLMMELDSLTENDRVLVVATCNNEKCLGEALLRPGRFDRVIKVPVPDEHTRKAIVTEYFERIKVEKHLNYDYLAKITSGCSGAYIECLANEVGIVALSKDNPEITLQDVRKVMNRINFRRDSEENIMSKEDKYKLAVHETGHCLTTMILCPGEIVDVTIRPQGRVKGFSVSSIPENKLMMVSDYEKLIAQVLGGHVAERIVFNEYGAGSESDLASALEYANICACSNGAYGYRYICGSESTHLSLISKTFGDDLIDCLTGILDKQDKVAEKIITEHRRLFDTIVNALVEKQTLSKDELEEMMAAVEETAAA